MFSLVFLSLGIYFSWGIGWMDGWFGGIGWDKTGLIHGQVIASFVELG